MHNENEFPRNVTNFNKSENVKVEISQIFIISNFEQSKFKNKVLYEK
jgi:hypothetical protein